jgi:O-antigen ligase
VFAVPGILALIVFIYLRPQEVFEAVRALPFLHVFLGLTVIGFIVDLATRKIRARPTPQLTWALLFLFWAIITIVIKVPGPRAKEHVMLLIISFTLFAVIAHGIQSFRSFSLMCTVLVAVCLILSVVGVHQATAPRQCFELAKDEPIHLGVGQPDGRPCDLRFECYDEGADPEREYLCERAGLLGTSTIQGRVRYRGVLQDPNELALAVTLGLPFLFALVGRRRSLRWYLIMAAGIAVVFLCVVETRSRSGQLALLGALGVYFLKRFRWRGAILGVVMALPILLAGGRGGSAAGQSTIDRYEAWRAGIDMVRMHPVLGVGEGMFTEYHHLTAHNSYLLAASELGLLGMVLWVMLVYLSLKIGIAGMRMAGDSTEAEEARAWGTALVASLVAFLISMVFLSLTYHMVLWIYLGVAGAYYSAVKTNFEDFEVRLGPLDYVLVGGFCGSLLVAVMVLLRVKGF